MEKRLHQLANLFGSLLFIYHSLWLLRTIPQRGITCEYPLTIHGIALAHRIHSKQFDQDSISNTGQRYSRQTSDRGGQATETLGAQEKSGSRRQLASCVSSTPFLPSLVANLSPSFSTFLARTVAQARVALDHALSDIQLVVQTMHNFGPKEMLGKKQGEQAEEAPSLEVGLQGSWGSLKRG